MICNFVFGDYIVNLFSSSFSLKFYDHELGVWWEEEGQQDCLKNFGCGSSAVILSLLVSQFFAVDHCTSCFSLFSLIPLFLGAVGIGNDRKAVLCMGIVAQVVVANIFIFFSSFRERQRLINMQITLWRGVKQWKNWQFVDGEWLLNSIIGSIAVPMMSGNYLPLFPPLMGWYLVVPIRK